jgi:hypothetical protein
MPSLKLKPGIVYLNLEGTIGIPAFMPDDE